MSLPTMHLEAVLFSSAKPISIEMLEEVFELSKEEVQDYIDTLQRELEEKNRGIRLRVSGAGIELVSAMESADYVGHIRKREDKLSNAAMETLAVIAYKQPITKAEIEEIRGVNSDKIIKQLLTRSLIAELGHKDTVGRPILYGTTDEFLRSAGVESIEALHQEVQKQKDNMERLQKFIASCGVASRRKAEELITEGKVQVNGRRITELGVKIDPQKDKVKVNGQLLAQEKPVYYLLNKPKGVITSVSDPQGRETVIDYIKNESKRIYPIGRLDLYTEGLLLLTNDGELAQNLTHPSKGVEKTYEVRIKGRVRDEDLQVIANGVALEDGITAPATIVDLGFDDHNGVHEVEITIHEGRNRQVRRMFEHFGYRIHNLKRIAYAGLTLGGVKRGGSRQLTIREVKALKALGAGKE